MHRCATLAAALLAAAPAFAQITTRTFNGATLRGEITFLQAPEILLNGQASRLAPGARVRNEYNLLQMSGALSGGRYVVNYTHDQMGQPLEIWILTAAEMANTPWPKTDAEARSWTFDAAAQTWTASK